MAEVLFVANDNVIEVASLTNGLTDALVSGATVTVTLKDAAGASVSGLATGVTWPLTLNAASGATGTYRTTLPHGLSLTAGSTYTAEVTASGGAGLRAFWALPVRATARTS